MNFNLKQPLFLEASAGTGKTYTIERLVVQLVRMSDPLIELERILVVTFTRAAALELKRRIAKALEEALLTAEGQQRHRLHLAISGIDGAKIFTIHAFCLEMLVRHPLTSGVNIDLGISYREQLEVVKDLFRLHLNKEHYCEAQLAGALGLARGDPDRLARLILKQLGRGLPIAKVPSFEESRLRLTALLKDLGPLDLTHLEADFECLWPCYLELANRKGELKEGIRENVSLTFSLLSGEPLTQGVLERLIEEGSFLVDLIARGKLKKSAVVKPLYYPDLLLWLDTVFGVELDQMRSPLCTLARLASEAEALLKQRMEEQERLTFDAILQKMNEALQTPSFAQAVQGAFDACVVDEFQDTDPIQWAIFEKLFGHRSDFPLILVGDPKQSIYAFRGADLATYWRAKSSFDPHNCYSLGVNYRSSPSLVSALNTFFASIDDFDCPPVAAGVKEDSPLAVGGALQLFEAEEEAEGFAFICEEIEALHQDQQIPYSDFAVLIADRFEAEKLRSYAQSWGLPCASMRGKRCADTVAYQELRALVDAALNRADRGKVKRLMSWGQEERISLILREGYAVLEEKGFLSFFEFFLASIGQEFLRAQGGEELFVQMRQIAGTLAGKRVEELLPYLDQLAVADEEDEEALKLFAESDESQVQLLTTFASKGLEYRVVFALGLGRNQKESRAGLVQVEGKLSPFAPAALLEQERRASFLRLLYVALTRAKERVYLPSSLQKWMKGELVGVKKAQRSLRRKAADLPLHPLLPPPKIAFPLPCRELQSFTRLSSPREEEGEFPSFVGGATKTAHTLPPGPRTGRILHELLEKRGDVRQALKGTSLEGWEEVVQGIVEACWSIDLGGFCLEQVTEMEQEMEFLYPSPQGEIEGVIDLFFTYQDKYYLLDWKTNWLGPDGASYTQERMQAEIERHDYRLQSTLYKEALSRYFRFFPHFDYGGTYYLFVRGAPEGKGLFKLF
ncbi:MAG: UvrD-helicase domain-containing protein [Verrucomicrobia bacterium]|nr:UvrD-helicase domain-containing protein [Verrucomicrobiota bacterium]